MPTQGETTATTSRCNTPPWPEAGGKEPRSFACCRGVQRGRGSVSFHGQESRAKAASPSSQITMASKPSTIFQQPWPVFLLKLHQPSSARNRGCSHCIPPPKDAQVPRHNSTHMQEGPRAGAGLRGMRLSPQCLANTCLQEVLKKKKAEFQYIPLHHVASD